MTMTYKVPLVTSHSTIPMVYGPLMGGFPTLLPWLKDHETRGGRALQPKTPLHVIAEQIFFFFFLCVASSLAFLLILREGFLGPVLFMRRRGGAHGG